MLWDWGWTWKSLQIVDCTIGIRCTGSDLGGSLQIMDTAFTGVEVGIFVALPSGSTAVQTCFLTLQNVAASGTPYIVGDYDTGTILDGGTNVVVCYISISVTLYSLVIQLRLTQFRLLRGFLGEYTTVTILPVPGRLAKI